MSRRMMSGFVALLLVVVVILDVSGIAPGAGRQVIPFLALLLASLFIWRSVWPSQISESTGTLDIPVEAAQAARLHLTYGAGDLAVAADAPAESLLAGEFAGSVRQQIERDADATTVTLRQPFSLMRRRANWRIGLSPAVNWQQVKLTLGASNARVDCSGLPVEALLMETGGTTLDVHLPVRGTVSLQLSGGSATLRVPSGSAVEIVSGIRLGEVRVDEARFLPDASGMNWATGDFAGGDDALRISLRGGLGSVEVVTLQTDSALRDLSD